MIEVERMKYTKSSPLRVFTTFSGYDSQCLALRKAGIPFDLVGWSEIDKNAINAHDVLFPEYKDRNYGDICKINWEETPDFDLFTYSSPCQSFSIAGKQLGGEEGSGTHSSLLWECKKAIEIKRPKYLMLENVKNLVGNKFFHTFQLWLDFLSSLGYTSYWQVLNGSDFGIPQARERVFVISVLNPDGKFRWPSKVAKTNCMNDFLMSPADIPERCYVGRACIEEYVKSNPNLLKFAGETQDDVVTKRSLKDTERFSQYVKTGKQSEYVSTTVKEYDEEFDQNLFGESPDEVKIERFGKILQIGNVRINRETFDNPYQSRVYSPKGLAPTLTTFPLLILVKENETYQIREITGGEGMRLMGVDFDDVKKLMDAGFGDDKLRKLSGNSIVVNVMSVFFNEMIKV